MSLRCAQLIARSQPPFARITNHRDIGPAISLFGDFCFRTKFSMLVLKPLAYLGLKRVATVLIAYCA